MGLMPEQEQHKCEACGVRIFPQQAETTKITLEKSLCTRCAEVYSAETGNALIPDTKPLVDCGFKIEKGFAKKMIGEAEIRIDISRLHQKGKAVEVGGYDYDFGINEEVDKELKKVFAIYDQKKKPAQEQQTKQQQQIPPRPPVHNISDTRPETKKQNKDAPTQSEKSKPVPQTSAKPPEKPISNEKKMQVETPSFQGNIIKGFIPQLKEVGKIKIGRKSEKTTGSGYRLPEKFDHFQITTLLRNEHGDLILDTIMKELENEPKELDIMLLYNDPTLNFFTRYNEYRGGKCICSGDGKIARTSDGLHKECNPDTC